MMKYIENQEGTYVVAIKSISCNFIGNKHCILINDMIFYKFDDKTRMRIVYNNILDIMNTDCIVIKRGDIE